MLRAMLIARLDVRDLNETQNRIATVAKITKAERRRYAVIIAKSLLTLAGEARHLGFDAE
jgi:hypothetical protein